MKVLPELVGGLYQEIAASKQAMTFDGQFLEGQQGFALLFGP